MKFRIDVLDKGYVEFIDMMGDDKRICEAARHCTSSEDNEKDRELIRYLMRHRHTSPFEFVEITFKIKLPIFIARQWVRHRMASLNEVSGRYTELKTEFYTPDKNRIKGKGKYNKQGSEGEVDELFKETWLESINRHYSDEADLYNMANGFGISNELARISLPVSTYTTFYWKIDLHNLFHFLKLRLDDHAQFEIQEYAKAIFIMLKDRLPISCEAFEDYILNAKTLSKQEMEAIQFIWNEQSIVTVLNAANIFLKSDLEKNEFYKKIGLKK